jgi:hypothetical protein
MTSGFTAVNLCRGTAGLPFQKFSAKVKIKISVFWGLSNILIFGNTAHS